MNVLVIGSGGREHAIAWKVRQSPHVQQVIVAPGNAGTALEPGVENASVDVLDHDGLVALARERDVGLTIVGPEAPLVAGIADRFAREGLAVFGPSAAAAELEGSKAFTKAFLERHGIPTARYRDFDEPGAACDYVRAQGAPIVVKADGLAAGKGVVVATSVDEACAAVEHMLSGAGFGDAGRRVVIEECLQGEEASFIAMVSGRDVVPLATSQDHKARDDGDRGPNTGGMGAYSPAPVIDAAMHERVIREVIEPTVNGLADDGVSYVGFLYAGLMIGADGVPRVLEFNCRAGDPETQPIMMRLRSDLVTLCLAAVGGTLGDMVPEWDPRLALGVVMAAGGYPGAYSKDDPIAGLGDDAPDTRVFHAGTRLEGERVVTAGGRVLCVCALGESAGEAQRVAYERVRTIEWAGCFSRRDIGYRAVARERGGSR